MGASSSVNNHDCNACDMMNAMVSVFGSAVFGFGAETDEDYDGCLPKDVRYWRVLKACQRNNIPETRELLQDFLADESLALGKVASVFCDCSLIATRMNYVSMIMMIREEAGDRDDIPSKLAKRQDNLNCLAEAIRLGHYDIVENLLKWRWRYRPTRSGWSYMEYLKLILTGDLYLDDGMDKQLTREKMLRSMFDWTEEWRNIAEMKGFLVWVGEHNAQWALQAAVDALRSQHYFRHERGEAGSFTSDEPLSHIAGSGNPEMLKLYFDNQHLLLPHTTSPEHLLMRSLTLQAEFNRDGGARADVTKLIVEYSQDLLDEKRSLHSILIDQFDRKLETWAWLATMVGLESKCEDHNNQSLGSIMLASAVSELNVETVRFLVNNGVQLVGEASTFQVYEDDPMTMQRLSTVRKLLKRGGQGAVRERRVIESTFLPIYTSAPRRRISDLSIRMKLTTAGRSANAATMAPSAYPRLLRGSLGSPSKPKSNKKAQLNVTPPAEPHALGSSEES